MPAPADFDTFLSHNSEDKEAARQLKRTLEARELTVWFDEDQLRPGLVWRPLLSEGLNKAGSITVALGGSGMGPWQNEETRAALNDAAALERPVIPVLLPNFRDHSNIDKSLGDRTWVDLRAGFTEEQVDRLVWGITGEKAWVAENPIAALSPVATKWILTAGSGGSTPRPANIDAVSERLGLALAEAGFSLVTGGWNGVDHIVARAFAERIRHKGQSLSARLVQVMHERATPDFPAGRLISGGSDDEAWRRSIERADAVVLIGGLGGTYQTGELALQAKKPVFPLADTRGVHGDHQDAYNFYFAMLENWSRNPASQYLTKNQFEVLSNPASGVVDDLIDLLTLTFGK